jgi:hypothetical protein
VQVEGPIERVEAETADALDVADIVQPRSTHQDGALGRQLGSKPCSALRHTANVLPSTGEIPGQEGLGLDPRYIDRLLSHYESLSG